MCDSGFQGDGYNCKGLWNKMLFLLSVSDKYLSKSLFSFTFTDVNECASPDTNGCDRNALCTNIEGSYICRCLKGYQGDGRFCAGKDIHQP